MNDVNDEILALGENVENAAVATVVRTRGSTPREVGARMLVTGNGAIRGTVGGGCGEAEVWGEAMDVLRTGTARLIEVDLLHDQDAEGGRACGGIMYVYIEPILSDPQSGGTE